MAVSADLVSAPTPEGQDEPRAIDPGLPRADRIFRMSARTIGGFVLLLTLAIGLFLGYQTIPTLHRYGLTFFTQSQWIPNKDVLGLGAVIPGTIEVAVIAVGIGFVLALASALYISEYSPVRLRATLVALVDLMAGIPSIVFGLWAVFLLEPHAIYVTRWLSEYLGWIPFFKVDFNTRAGFVASDINIHYAGSAAMAGIAVSTMVIPLACSVMRSVFAQAPIGEREAAIALGASRWGVVRTVVLPFGRRGIIGGTMLGLGRALGETVAVLLVIEPLFVIKYKILTPGIITSSSLIANYFGDATGAQLHALLAAGFVLFVMTLAINTIAAVFVNRSRSGAGTDL
ncbi:MAG TPA: phosphate ABC transporter permease subunit PstC [Actinomycetota bacterium]|nr:phosphate ABC transporter permease subunit PstC [Actinomycetota bacterium]